jgi:hypothetical protein
MRQLPRQRKNGVEINNFPDLASYGNGEQGTECQFFRRYANMTGCRVEPPMIVKESKSELIGKTIAWAGVIEREGGDAEFLMRFVDGSTATVAAWKREGYSLQMNVDLSPNTDPVTDGGPGSRRGI